MCGCVTGLVVLHSVLRHDPLDVLEHHLPHHCHPSTQHEALLEVWWGPPASLIDVQVVFQKLLGMHGNNIHQVS